MEKIVKRGFLSDLDNNKLLYLGTLTLDDQEITFSGKGNGVAVFKSLDISIPLNAIQNVAIKKILLMKYLYIEFVKDGQIRRVMIRPFTFFLIEFFDDSKKWEKIILDKIRNK